METQRIHNVTEQEYSVQRTCFMHSDNSFSKRSSFDPEPEDLFDKFSPSKAVQVDEQECSKRPLVIDRDLAVPFKKRKQLHEESDSCDVSTDQNLQKSDNKEENSVTFCSKLERENVHEPTPSTSQKAYNEGQIEFNLQSSVFVKEDDSTEWTRLKCFDSITFDESNSATFFAGGPIQSSAFFKTPHDMKVNEYVAVAVSNDIYNKHLYTNTKNMNGLIQFWNLGSLHERKSLNQLPSMELALYHDNGIITDMKWCPADCYDKCPSTCHLPRLGLLAVSSSDSCVYIYSVPQPDFMPKLKPTFPVYFTQPYMKLTPLFGEPNNVTRKTITMCVEWEKNGERIVAGYGNGSVCVWMIKVSLFTSHIGVKCVDQSYIIQPYLFFQSSGSPILRLSFAPFSNHRWLLVLSLDGFIQLFDLLDPSAPFMVVKEAFGPSCIWGETFCGVLSSPILTSGGLISLSAVDCLVENTKPPRSNQKNGIFDSSTHVVASENGNIHAIADMAGAVTVNYLNDMHKPYETSYLTYMLLETEIMTLDSVDLEAKTSESKINISGNVLNNEISSVSDTKGPFYTTVKQGSSSSSSSGFCSPKHGKTIVIEMAQCFEDDAVNLLKSPPESSVLNNFKDSDNNEIKAFLNKPLNPSEEANDEVMKCSEFSEDLMRDLLMVKISNQSKSSSHTLPINSSSNFAYCDSKGAKHLSSGTLITSSAASDYTGDTIMYPLEDYFCDTSHTTALNSVESNVQSKSFGLKEKRNTLNETTVCKISGKPALECGILAKNSLDFSCSEVKSGNSSSNENSSSKNWCDPNTEKSSLNYENKNLRETDYLNSDHFISFIRSNSFHSNDCLTSKHSDIHRKKEIIKNSDTFQNLDTKGNLISKKDATNHSLHKNFDDPLCDVLRPNNLNQPKPLPDMCSSTTSNDFIICDRDDPKLSIRAFNQSPATSDYSGETDIYSHESYDYNDIKYLNSKKSDAISQSLCNREQENTFQDISLHKMEEEAILHESKTKLLTENGCSFAREKCENFLAKESLLKCKSEYETDSATESCNLSDEDRNFDQKDIFISNFHLLHSEYLCDKSEEKYTVLNELPQSDNDPRNLSYENLISNFGVIFKNSLDTTANPLESQENGIYIKYNPLSVIKTISWDPNQGCQSWLFIGGNSGIGRLVFVPDSLADTKKPEFINKRKRNRPNVS